MNAPLSNLSSSDSALWNRDTLGLLKMDLGVVVARSLTLSINNCVITMQQFD